MATILALTVLVSLLVASHYYYLEQSNRDALSQRAGSTVQLLSIAAHRAVLSEDLNTLKDLARQAFKQPDVSYFTIQDADGHFLLFQGRDGITQENYKKRADMAHAVAIIKESGYIFAMVELGLSRAQMQQVVNRAMLWSWSVGGGLWLLGCCAILVVGWRLGRGELRYHGLFANHTAIKLLVDPQNDYRIIDANGAAEQFYGYSRQQLCGLKISQINVLSELEIVHEMANASREGRDYFFFRHRLANGEEREVEVHSGPVLLDGRTILYQIVHDVTQRRRTEQELERSRTELELANRRLHTVLDGLEATVFVADSRTLQVLYVNHAMWGLVGDVVGQSVTRLFSRGGEAAPVEFWQPQQLWPKLGEHATREYQHPLDGKWYLAHIHGVEWCDGRLVRLEIATDISRLKESQRAIHQAMELAEASDQAKGVLLETVSHAFVQPLQQIVQLLSVIREDPLLNQQGHRVVAMERVVAQLNARIQDLHALSQLQGQSAAGLERVPFRFGPLLERLRGYDSMVALAERGAQVVLDLDDAAADQRFMGDPGRYLQLLSALLRIYTLGDPSGRIVLRLLIAQMEGLETTVHLEVLPEQQGVTKKSMLYRPLLLNPHVVEGGELALLLVVRLAEWLGVSVDIAHEGEGLPAFRLRFRLTVVEHASYPESVDGPHLVNVATTFVASALPEYPAMGELPAGVGHAEVISHLGVGHGGGLYQRPLKLLLIEDDLPNQLSMRKQLEDRGHHVFLAQTGPEGLALAQVETWDFVLVAHPVAGMSGLEVVQQLRQAEGEQDAESVPVVVMLVEVTRQMVEASHQAGGDEVLAKPVNTERLTALIRRFTGTKEQAPEISDPMQELEMTQQLNYAHLDNLLAEMSLEAFQKLSSRFEQNALGYLQKAAEGLQARDETAVHVALHTLAGSAASFGLAELAERMRHASHQTVEADGVRLESEILQARAELSIGMQELSAYVAAKLGDHAEPQ
ncbi:PAS domain S-box protein [Magnetococcus marinus]|uniref:PAS domain S-box protein n=1 Tax=Magnetococcus marinus TaxID=1124597 RepID=UPI0002F0073C|nr:PAS domain S-box protein [Magnetococcus marinus]